MTEWFTNEEYWRETYSFMFPEEKFQKCREEAEKIIRLSELK
jgi:hypothetical protein